MCVCVVFPLFISSSLLSYFPEHYVMVNNVEENIEFNTICTHYRHVTVLIKLTMIVTYTNLIHIPTNCVSVDNNLVSFCLLSLPQCFFLLLYHCFPLLLHYKWKNMKMSMKIKTKLVLFYFCSVVLCVEIICEA